MTTRRNFFGWMAASPLAVKAAGDKAVAELMKIDVNGVEDGGGGFLMAPSSVPNELSLEKKLSNCLNYVKVFGLPSEVEEQYRINSRVVRELDYDIANKKSWSMAFKVCCQRQRNYERILQGLDREARLEFGRLKLRNILGFEFPMWYR